MAGSGTTGFLTAEPLAEAVTQMHGPICKRSNRNLKSNLFLPKKKAK
jgi:hypothetical protein